MKRLAQAALLGITFGGAFGLTLATSVAASTAPSAAPQTTTSCLLSEPTKQDRYSNSGDNSDQAGTDRYTLGGGF